MILYRPDATNSLIVEINHCVFHRETENQLNTKDDGNTAEPSSTRYNIEFTFDSDVKCAITIYYFATEEIVNKQAVYVYHTYHTMHFHSEAQWRSG